jgi:hypothetical protein
MTTVRYIALVLTIAAISGCSGDGDSDVTDPSDGATPDDGSGGNDTADDDVVAPPTQELLNTTLEYPRAAGQPADQESFTVPADAVAVRIWYQAIHDCPTPSLGYQDNAQIVFEPPGGEPIAENLFQSGAGSVDCNNEPQRHQVNPDPVPGEWTVRTEGVYSGSVSVAVIANPPEAGA